MPRRRRTGDNYSGPRFLFAQAPRPSSGGGGGRSWSGSSRRPDRMGREIGVPLEGPSIADALEEVSEDADAGAVS